MNIKYGFAVIINGHLILDARDQNPIILNDFISSRAVSKQLRTEITRSYTKSYSTLGKTTWET